MKLHSTDKQAIEKSVAAFEQATGAQALVSVVDRCDSYPEVPWRAFALGVSLAALLVWLVPLSGSILHFSTSLMLVVVLGAGMAAALLTIGWPASGRWLLPMARRQMEVGQYAQGQFLTRELFATRERSAILMLIGLYEGCGVILVDRGLQVRLPADQLERATTKLNTALTAGGLANAAHDSLAVLQAALSSGVTPHGNEFADSVIQERGH